MHLSPQRPGTPEFPPPTPSGGGGYKWDPGGGYGSFSDMTSSVLPTLNQTCRALNGMTVPMGTPYTFLGYAWEWDPHTHSNYRTAKISFGSPPVTVIIPASCL